MTQKAADLTQGLEPEAMTRDCVSAQRGQPLFWHEGIQPTYQMAAAMVVGLALFFCLRFGSELLLRSFQALAITYEFSIVLDRSPVQPAVYFDTGSGLSEAQSLPLSCAAVGQNISCTARLISPI